MSALYLCSRLDRIVVVLVVVAATVIAVAVAVRSSWLLGKVGVLLFQHDYHRHRGGKQVSF